MEKEVFYEEVITVRVEAEKGKIKSIEVLTDSGYGVRVAKNGKIGFGFAKSEERAEELAKKSMIRKFYGFPEKEKVGKEIFHKIPLDPEVLVERIREMEEVLEPKTSISAFASIVQRRIWNTNGIEAREKQSWIGYSAYTAENGSEGWEWWEGRKDEKKWVEVAEKAMEIKETWKKPEEKLSLPVVLSSRSASALLSQFLSHHLSAEQAIHGQSIFQIGKRFGTATIIQKPMLHATAFDGEGIKPKEVVVLENGIFRAFLNDFSTAVQMNTKPTGNAGRSWNSYPKPAMLDLVYENEKADIDEFVLVTDVSGVHTIDPISGRFSIEAHQSFVMPDMKPVKPFLLNGTLEQLLSAKEVGEREQRGNWFVAGLLLE